VVSFTPRPLYPRGKSPLYPLDMRWTTWRKFLTLPGLEPRPLGRPAHSQSLYRLRSKIQVNIVTIYGCCVTCKTGLGLDDRIYCTVYDHTLGSTSNTALSLIYTLRSSPLPTHYGSRSSLVVSWQRIYNSLIVTSHHA
jgi:hypothetical protein